MARPAASSRSTSRTLEYLRLTGRDRRRSPWSSLLPGAGPVARQRRARARLHRYARPRHERDRAVAGGAQAPAGPGAADRRRRPVQCRARGGHIQEAQRPPRRGRRRGIRRRQRRRRHRRDHQLHQYVEPVGAGRCRAGRERRARRGCFPSLGSRPASPRQPGGHRLFEGQRSGGGLDALGFDLVGYGCTTCIGNSGPLAEPISKAINENDLVAVSVLSGNRNFEGRVSPDCRANYLASPPLVVAYALKGTVRADLVNEPIGIGSDGSRCSSRTSGRRTKRSAR